MSGVKVFYPGCTVFAVTWHFATAMVGEVIYRLCVQHSISPQIPRAQRSAALHHVASSGMTAWKRRRNTLTACGGSGVVERTLCSHRSRSDHRVAHIFRWNRSPWLLEQTADPNRKQMMHLRLCAHGGRSALRACTINITCTVFGE